MEIVWNIVQNEVVLLQNCGSHITPMFIFPRYILDNSERLLKRNSSFRLFSAFLLCGLDRVRIQIIYMQLDIITTHYFSMGHAQ